MSKLTYFLVSLMLLISSKANVFSDSYIFIILCFLITFSLFLYKKIRFDKYYLYFGFFYFIISFCYYFIFDYVDLLYIFYYFLLLSYAYLTLKILKYDFFIALHNVIYFLASLSIPLYILQLIDLNFMFNLIGFFQHNISFLEFNNEIFANNLIFSIDRLGGDFRNSGFAWEPKGFANFLIIAIFINTNLYNFKINRKIIIFIIALITTFSTVGFIIISTTFVLYIFYNQKISKIGILLFSFLSILVLVLGNQLIFEKIKVEMAGVEKHVDRVYDKRTTFKQRSLGRFGSFIIDFNDFKKQPLIGYGIQRRDANRKQLRTESKYTYTKLVRVNGFSDRLASFGIVGIIFYISALFLGFRKYLKYYNNKGAIFMIISFFIIEFATNVLTDPLWMVFLFLFAINPREVNNSFNKL